MKKILVLSLALLMSITLVGCKEDSVDTPKPVECETGQHLENDVCVDDVNPIVDSNSPVISLNGELVVNLDLGQSWTDPGATCSDDTDATCAVTVGGTYSDTSAVGTFEITYNAQDAAGNAATEVVRSIVITDPADAVAPVVTVSNSSVTMVAGETIVLPSVTASDDVDGDITDDLYVYPVSSVGNVIENDDGTFSYTTTASGEHKVAYNALDSAGNETEEFITINVTPVTTETMDVTGVNDLEELTGYGVFKENFELAEKSPLVFGSLLNHVSIDATSNAISGNSLVIDYSEVVGGENIFFIDNIGDYLESGKWTISFDVKLVSGTPTTDVFFGYNYQGSTSSVDYQLDFSGLSTAGDVITINYEQVINFADEDYWFHIFKLDQQGATDMVLAFDNFVFTYEYANTTNYIPTLTELESGYTYTWDEVNSMAIGGAEVIPVASIENQDAQDFITNAASGFSTNVNHVTGLGGHVLGGFDTSNLEVGKYYTITFEYYSVSSDGFNFIMLDGTSGNHNLGAGMLSAENGGGTFELEYTILPGEYAITIYTTGDIDMYFGDMTITMSEPPADTPYVTDRTDYKTLTKEDIITNGITFTHGVDDAINISSNDQYAIIAKLGQALIDEMTAANGFSSDQALHLKGTSDSYIDSFANMLESGYKYTISFNAYVVDPGSVTILLMNDAMAQNSQHNFNVTQVSGNIYEYSVEIYSVDGDVFFNFYGINSYELYVGDITVVAEEVIVETGKTPLGFEEGQVWEKLPENGYFKGTLIDTPASVTGEGVGTKVSQFDLTADTTYELFQGGGMVEADITYLITVKYYVESITGDNLMLRLDGNFIPMTDVTVGYHEFTFEFTGAFDYFSLFNTGATTGGVVYLAGVEIELVNIPKESVLGFTEGHVWEKLPEDGYFKGTVIDTPASVTGEGVGTKVSQFDLTADTTYELFQGGSFIEANADYLVTVKYYVESITGDNLMIRLDNNFIPMTDISVGYHEFTFTVSNPFDYFSLFNTGATTGGVVYLAGVEIELVRVREESVLGFYEGQVWEKLAADGYFKGTVIDTPATVTGDSVGAKVSQFDLTADTTYELFQGGGMVEAGNDYLVTVKYYVESITGDNLMLRLDGNFIPMTDVSVGYHEFTFEFTGAFDYFSLFNTAATTDGVVYLLGVEIELIEVN